MSRRYDTRTTSFTSEGLLPQVEYAFQSVSKSTPTLGILTKEGLVIYTLNRSGVSRQEADAIKTACTRKME